MDNITKVFEALGEKIKNLEFDNQMKDMQIEHLKKELERLQPKKESRPQVKEECETRWIK